MLNLWNRILNLSDTQIQWLLAGIGAILFIPFLGYVHLFDWDEINFAEISREMIITGKYTRVYVNFIPFWEKPPLFFWLQSSSMLVFGVNEFAARFPNALCGIITLPVLYNIGNKLFDKKFGLLWALVYLGSILPNFYFQSGIIDPVFNLFIFLGLYFFILYYWRYREIDEGLLNRSYWHYLVLASIFSGLAILTKGPAGFLILLLCYGVYFVMKRFRFYFQISHFIIYCVVSIIVALFWFGAETAINGPWFVTEFIKYNLRLASTEDAGHGGFPGYHFVVVFVGCFPSSLFALRSFRKMKYDMAYRKDFKNWMMILMWVVLILFSIVQSKIVHYSSMAYFPVTFLGTLVIYKLIEGQIRYPKWIGKVIIPVGVFVGSLMIIIPILGLNISVLANLIKDPFVLGNLEADSGWTGFELLTGLLLILISVYGVKSLKRQKYLVGVIILFVGTALTIKLANVLFAKNIEAYSQRAAVEFFESVQEEDAYLHTVGYKSYVQLFYGRTKPENKPFMNEETMRKAIQEWQDWLFIGEIDKPVYFSTKVDKTYRFEEYPDIKELYRKNGFVFYRRDP